MSNFTDGLIFDLDQGLVISGTDVILRRTVGIDLEPLDLKCRMLLRGYLPQELVGEITQQDQSFILSPSQITEKQWPGFISKQNPNADNRVPRKNDIIVSERGKATVQAAAGIYIDGVLIRIEGRVRG